MGRPPSSTEIELKLALPGAHARRIAGQVAAIPRLADVPATELRLRNLYFDTPEQNLRRARAALRLRSVQQDAAPPRWMQTFKTAAEVAGALSHRREWETPVCEGRIDPTALQATPWPALDVDGQWLARLAPCFETESLRTLRRVRAAGGGCIEVVLDVGSVRTGAGRSQDVVELELELIEGHSDALFELAAHIATCLAVLPAVLSKAERGWRLVDGCAHAPRHARRLELTVDASVAQAMQIMLGEALNQWIENLGGIASSDDPELVHQARVGWRRWRSALWLFKPLLAGHPPPDTAGLRPLLIALGTARDLDVAALDTLPQWRAVFTAGDARRARQWQAMQDAVTAERATRRAALLSALQAPATGQALIALERWLAALPQAAPAAASRPVAGWAWARVCRLHRRLEREQAALDRTVQGSADAMQRQHRVRLLSKRTRYVLQALLTVLPDEERARRWLERATRLQTRIGAMRDLMLLPALLEPLGAHPAILACLRGAAAMRLAPG